MAGFDEYAEIQKVYHDGDGVKFKLLRDLMYRDEAGHCHVIKAGFISDLGSIPRLLWPILPPHAYPSSYILHDWYCKDLKSTRKYGDDLLLESLKYCNAPSWKRWTIYLAVRAYAILTKKT